MNITTSFANKAFSSLFIFLKIRYLLSNIETIETIRPMTKILMLLTFNNILLECSQVNKNIINKVNASVIAVPSATPNAGLFLNNSKPNINEKVILVITANKRINK